MSEHGMNEIRVLLDTDANNEIDDQHAIAYLLLSGDSFILEGITVNKTNNGGDIHEQAKEAERVIKLCDMEDKISVTLGASDSFSEIQSKVMNPVFDGSDAVDLMIERAHRNASQVLTILAIGKLTNIALAIKKDPTIVSKIKVVWLGSNYPLPGEYNLESDSESMNFVIASGVLFEILRCYRYCCRSTFAVTVTPQDLK
jgi:inosine-uridine nucleoside N-ribohydrolase